MNRIDLSVCGIAKSIALIVLFAYSCVTLGTDKPSCKLNDRHEFWIDEGWIDVSNGRDEDSHRLRFEIWGPIRVSVLCASLDAEAEDEIIIISRSAGSGAYYRIQIIDFLEDGIMTRSYGSDGMPKVEAGKVLLGSLIPEQRQVPMHPPTVTEYIYRSEYGLVDRNQEIEWIQFIQIGKDKTNSIMGASFRLAESCQLSGAEIVSRLKQNQVEAAFECLSNADLQRLLENFI